MEALSLYELNALVRQILERQVSATYWVQAELSDVRVNASGHCYVEFVQKSPRGNALVAKARGTIWANVFQMLKPYFEEATGQAFAPGIKVLVCVSVSFHELYGYSLMVHDIDPAYTLGDLAQRRREILRQLEEEGVLTLNKELPMPLLPRRVAVISSPTAAGYGDFRHQLEHNPRGYYFQVELFPAVMQGDAVEETVLDALDRINARLAEFDVVVIIRGGGATSDLSGFDTYMLAAACAQFPLPIITGIGHERDDTVLDAVAHTRVKTPTAAAEYLIARMDETAGRLYDLAGRMQQAVQGRLTQEHRRVDQLRRLIPAAAYRSLEQHRRKLAALRTDIPRAAYRNLSHARLQLMPVGQQLRRAVSAQLDRHRHRLELLAQRIADASPDRLLARGYSLTLKDGRAVRDASALRPGDVLHTRLHQGTVRSVVTPDDTPSTLTINPEHTPSL